MSASFHDEKQQDLIFPGRKLSHREQEVAYQIARGISNKEAAENLYVTEKTIKFHLTSIYKKLGVKTRSQLIVMALRETPPEVFKELEALAVEPVELTLPHRAK